MSFTPWTERIDCNLGMGKAASQPSELVRLAWPVLIAQLALVGNSVIDTAMAGRLSEIDLAAVGIAASVLGTVLMSLLSVLMALPPIIAQLYGAGRGADIGREIHQSLWVSVVLALVAILLLCFPGPLLAISDLQPMVEVKVRSYLDASAWGVPATIALRLFFGLSTGIGRPLPVMTFNVLALLLKVPLNAAFIYGFSGIPAMGGPGCAVATTVDAWLMATWAWIWCLHHPDYQQFQLRGHFSAPDPEAIFAFLRLGIPIGLTFAADITAFTLMALFIARLGPVVSGAHQIAANIAVLAFMFPLSLGTATAVLAGQAIGAKQQKRARQACWTGIALGLAIAVIISVTLWTWAPQVSALYTTNHRVQEAAAPLITLVGFYHLGDALQAVAVNALRGYKKSAVPMVIYATALWGMGLGGGFLLGLTDTFGTARGAVGFWLAAIASLWSVAAAVTLYLNSVSRTV